MAFATTHGNAVLDALTSQTISLHSADPGLSGANNEISGAGYSRQSATFGAASNKVHTNTNTVTFANMPAVTVTHAATWVSSVCKFVGPLSTPFVVSAGQSVQFAPGEITSTLT